MGRLLQELANKIASLANVRELPALALFAIAIKEEIFDSLIGIEQERKLFVALLPLELDAAFGRRRYDGYKQAIASSGFADLFRRLKSRGRRSVRTPTIGSGFSFANLASCSRKWINPSSSFCRLTRVPDIRSTSLNCSRCI